MARVQEFYKGKRKRRNYAVLPFLILLAVISVVLVLFYGMQKYAVISKDGVAIRLPILEDGQSTTVDSEGHVVREFEAVSVPLVFEEADYSYVRSKAGEYAPPVRAIFVPAENVNPHKIIERAARLVAGNALMLEMKPRSGNLMWYSRSGAAMDYGLSIENEVTNSIQRYVDMLKEKNVYLVAKISCCVDERFPAYSTLVALKTASGMNYYDETGMWLDPYSQKVRDYVVEMVQELYDIGFDEVALADLRHPVPEEDREVDFLYNAEMSTTPSAEGGICGFAITVAQRLADRPEGKVLSIYSYTPVSLVKTDQGTGQNTPLFFKLFDRVYYETDRGTYTYNLQDVTHSITESVASRRIVPVVVNYLPHNPDKISWVLIDKEEN